MGFEPSFQHVRTRGQHWVGALSVALLALLFPLLGGCSGGGGEGAPGEAGGPTISPATSSSATTAAVSLGWRPVSDPSVTGYVIHFGTSSPQSQGSCSYDRAEFFSGPAGTLEDLAPGTQYFFAVSSFNGIEGPCSREVTTVTPSA